VELVEGRLVTKMPKNPTHTLATGLLRKALEGIAPSGWHVDSQEPVTLSDGEPEPDAMVVRGDMRDYRDHHPGPMDVALIVEVSDSTLEYDRTEKNRNYARASIPVYWILNLRDRRLEVYSEPTGSVDPPDQPSYRQVTLYGPDQTVPVVLGGNEVARIAMQNLLP
jgi:Uma2 family endonuclease